ncbi:hypothetical protein MMC25_002856 [Agyrium rufum]|nr:hypothetical protein [Agyrium rufum]
MLVAPSKITCSSHNPPSSHAKDPLWQSVLSIPTRSLQSLSLGESQSRQIVQEDSDTSDPSAEEVEDQNAPALVSGFQAQPAEQRRTQLGQLPCEIQECILDHIVGNLHSVSATTRDGNLGSRNWSSIMRHPRRKTVTDLAMVSRTWRQIVQERIYRHVKVKGTLSAINDCAEWFWRHPHLQNYVRHIEIWVPVWEKKAQAPVGQRAPVVVTTNASVYSNPQAHPNARALLPMPDDFSQIFKIPTSNATLAEIFGLVLSVFPRACILTIEGGHCRKPPMIQYFRPHSPRDPNVKLPCLPTVTTLILKGAWNVLRSPSDFRTIAAALPQLRELHSTYAKPKIAAYQTFATLAQHDLINMSHLTHLNLCLEGFYAKEAPTHAKIHALQDASHHICLALARLLPQLETLTYTGRICATLFKHAALVASKDSRKPRLRSIDLIVKDCCVSPVNPSSSALPHNTAPLWLSHFASQGGYPAFASAVNASQFAPSASHHTTFAPTIPTIQAAGGVGFTASSTAVTATSFSSLQNSSGIRNRIFIQSFASLILAAASCALPVFPELTFLRMRYLDLDSPCPVLNPYFQLHGSQCAGMCNNAIIAALAQARPGTGFDEADLEEGRRAVGVLRRELGWAGLVGAGAAGAHQAREGLGEGSNAGVGLADGSRTGSTEGKGDVGWGRGRLRVWRVEDYEMLGLVERSR